MGMFLLPLLPIILAHQSQVRFQFMPPIGKAYHLRMTMNMTMDVPGMSKPGGAPFGMTMSEDVEMKALSRAGDITTMETTTSNPKFGGALGGMISGKAGTGSKMAPQIGKMEIDRNYKVISTGGSGTGVSSSFSSMSFPGRALKVGDSWTVAVDLGKMMGAMGKASTGASGNIPMKYRLVAIEHHGAETLAKISISTDATISTPAGGQSIPVHMVGKGAGLIDVASGVLRDMDMSINGNAKAQGQPMQFHIVEGFHRV